MARRDRLARTLVALILAGGLGSCFGLPAFESIPYGPAGNREVMITAEPGTVPDVEHSPAGWIGRGPDASAPHRRGIDPSPVPASAPGVVTTTGQPINDGVAADGAQGSGTMGPGSRGLLLDLYTDAVENVEILTESNRDLMAALEMAEQRGADFERQLKELQAAYDELGRSKQEVDQRSFDMAARLATAQIARLEAERALLEATLEWRRMSARNNAPLEGGAPGARGGGERGR